MFSVWQRMQNTVFWIGTYSGLNVLDKKTGAIRKIDHPEMNGNSIPQVLITSDERILFATDWGVYEYQEDKDDFLCHGGEKIQGM